MNRTIKPKLYEVKTDNGALFRVRALSRSSAKRFVTDATTGAWQVRAITDDEAFQLGRNGVEVLDATRAED